MDPRRMLCIVFIDAFIFGRSFLYLPSLPLHLGLFTFRLFKSIVSVKQCTK